MKFKEEKHSTKHVFPFNEALKLSGLIILNKEDTYYMLSRRSDCFDMNATESCIQAIRIKDKQFHEFPYDYLINEFNKGTLEFYGLMKMEVKNGH